MKTDFRYKRSFLSIAGAKVQQFGVENKFFRYRFFLGVFVSVWQIVLYNDISEINCCILTDFEENEGLWLRILEKRSFPVMVIFGQNHFRGRSVILYYNINNLYYNIAHFDRFHFHFDRKWPWPILTGFCFLHSKCLAYKI